MIKYFIYHIYMQLYVAFQAKNFYSGCTHLKIEKDVGVQLYSIGLGFKNSLSIFHWAKLANLVYFSARRILCSHWDTRYYSVLELGPRKLASLSK